jgi:hypothetical protein
MFTGIYYKNNYSYTNFPDSVEGIFYHPVIGRNVSGKKLAIKNRVLKKFQWISIEGCIEKILS